MTQPATNQKICVVCGKDVSQQKRTKDQLGRYYCQPCWEAKAGATVAAAPTKPAAPAKMMAPETPASAPPPAPAVPVTSDPNEPADLEELDFADEPSRWLGAGEELATPPPISAPAAPAARAPVVMDPDLPVQKRDQGARKMISMIGMIVAVVAAVAMVGGLGYGVYYLVRTSGTQPSKTSFAIANPPGLSAAPFSDPLLNCKIRFPNDCFAATDRAAGVKQRIIAGGGLYSIQFAAVDRDPQTDFSTYVRNDRVAFVMSKGNAATVYDEGTAKINGRDAYVLKLSFGLKKDRAKALVVYVDGPDNRVFVLTGQSAEDDWPQVESTIVNSFSTFAPIK